MVIFNRALKNTVARLSQEVSKLKLQNKEQQTLIEELAKQNKQFAQDIEDLQSDTTVKRDFQSAWNLAINGDANGKK